MEVIVTSMPEKLPPEVLQLQDTNRPLPPDVQFFERRYAYGDLFKQMLLGIVLIPVGVVIVIVAVALMFHIDRSSASYENTSQVAFTMAIVGLVVIGCGYLVLASLRPRFKFMRQQTQGVATRQGIFLMGDLLVSQDVMDTTVIPKPFFKGLVAHKVQYQLKDELKSFDLPAEFIGQDRQSLEAAIARWAA